MKLRRLLILALLCSVPASSALVGEALPRVELVGLRDGIAHASVDRWAMVARECEACATPLPANEWAWLRIDPEQTLIHIHYLERGRETRSMSEFAPFPGDILIPAPRENESMIRVTIRRQEFLFPVGPALPTDPREIRIDPDAGWTKYAVEMPTSELWRGFVFAATHDPAEPNGWFVDFDVTYVNGREHGLSAIVLGGRKPATQVALDAETGSAELSVTPFRHDGARVVVPLEFGSKPLSFVGRLGHGIAQPAPGFDELLFFSVDGALSVEPMASGPMTIAAATTEGVRLTAPVGSTMVKAHVEARAHLTDASLVVAQAAGGALGFGTSRVEHEGRVVQGHIGNVGSPLQVVSTGDCSGEWTASLDGSVVLPASGPFDAAIMSASGYDASSAFENTWKTRNGWCD